MNGDWSRLVARRRRCLVAGMAEADPEDALYGLPPVEFTAARNRLAKDLKGAGDREGSARVARLARPTITAWALNHVARSTPGLVDGLLAAGAELRRATERAVAGDAAGLRPAQAEQRRAIDAVVEAAEAALRDASHSPSDAVHQRLAGTLHAATVDEAVAGQLRAGRLQGDHHASGLGLSEEMVVAEPRPEPGKRPPLSPKSEAPRRSAARQARATEAQSRARELAGLAERLEAEAAQARVAADDAEAKAVQARVVADEAGAVAARLAESP